jgi:SpoVK/Ycf46/Vps4 family AAA+-type ATPase
VVAGQEAGGDADEIIATKQPAEAGRDEVALVGVLPIEADIIVIGGTPLRDGWPGGIIGLALQRHIHFRLPNASMRRELFSLHLPNPDRVTADYAVLAGLSRGLSGGDILNLCVNANHAGSTNVDPAKWAVTQAMLEREIEKVRKAKAEHSGEKQELKRRIWFC